MYDPELYRDKAEVEQWKQRCPIETFSAMLRKAGLLADADWKALESSVATEISDAVAAAEAGSWEPVEDLLKDVYTPATNATARSDRSPIVRDEPIADRPQRSKLVKP
jgi:TPP-dependent pyruvate/acetoin dehydrogenase alpha subunit